MYVKEKLLFTLLFLITGTSVATLSINAQAFEEFSEIWVLPGSIKAAEPETDIEAKGFDDSSEVEKKGNIKDLLLLCCYEAGAMLITGGAISHFNGFLVAIGGVIFGLSVAAIYDLFPWRKKDRHAEDTRPCFLNST